MLAWVLVFLAASWALSYNRASLGVWTLSAFIGVALLTLLSSLGFFAITLTWMLLLAVTIPLNTRSIRQKLFTGSLFNTYKRIMPPISDTERVAIESGTVSWEGELFSGKPNWKKLFSIPAPSLSEEEQAFIDGPVEKLCSMIDDWDITHNRCDLSEEMWKYIKENGFFGMIIPKKFGGKEFSAYAHSVVLTKLYGLSVTVASTVAVPNSLGPAELILKYGTKEQKEYYLPRLAKGLEVPCFALTGPEAGSDAGAIPDFGIVCKGQYEGKEIIGIKLNWNKRYITLAPVATVLGLAFKLYDPEGLIGNKKDIGITCALIPTQHKGVVIGRRHYPVNIPFQNGPTQGKDVFIPLDWIIGGIPMAGQGWRMLIECLATGRAISLPASSVGGAKVITHATGAYARIRRQFNVAIGQFEGIEEVLARIAGRTYLIDSARTLTTSLVDQGEMPAVPSAIIKYHITETGRKIANDGMDVHGGKGICLGPNNYIVRGWEAVPISITVEGANILTRCLMIFGQGATRCHPYVLEEIEAALEENADVGLKRFDKAIMGHAGYIISNIARTLFLSLTFGRFVVAPKKAMFRHYQKIVRYGSAFAFIADMAMVVIGSDLKRKERVSARLGDIFSYLYLASSVLKRFEDQGRPESDKVLVDWCCQYLFNEIQASLDQLIHNFPNPLVAAWLRLWIFPLGRREKPISDKLDHQVASVLLTPSDARQRLTQGAYLSDDGKNVLALLERTMHKVIATEAIEKRLLKAVKEGEVKGFDYAEKVAAAVEANVLTEHEAEQLLEMNQLRSRIIAVDDFGPDELVGGGAKKTTHATREDTRHCEERSDAAISI